MPKGLCNFPCQQLLQEDNVRFILHAAFMVAFTVIGAFIFMALESDVEQVSRDCYNEILDEFLRSNPSVNITQLNILLAANAYATMGGFLNTSRPRWDFAGSLYYVGTLVSSVGMCKNLTTDSTHI